MSGLPMLFCRQYQHFFGGHLKHAHYVAHTAAHEHYTPQLFFTPDSVLDDTHPWVACAAARVTKLALTDQQVFFVAGEDWRLLDNMMPNWHHKRCPVINLIQHVRHAEPMHSLYSHLSRPAIRICVSQAVQQAIVATGQINGPIITINNGIDLPVRQLPKPMTVESLDSCCSRSRGNDGGNVPAFAGMTAGTANSGRPQSILLVGYKRPTMAHQVSNYLQAQGISVTLMDTWLPRAAFLHSLQASDIAVFFPHETEGFYLPALEAMALGVLVICPDAIGNRGFCIDGQTCLQPDYHAEAMAATVRNLLVADVNTRQQLRKQALAMAQNHSLAAERQQFHAVLDRLFDLW